ncbi:MAG TPA: hypothetical protein VKY19_29850 [Ktedonosporobacter sp.]|jgi:hypothetical protein|nr:hypothetical protein [Ktedonosporobacter sp.]
MHNNSEVAELLENIRLSYEAAHAALYGPAIVGRHEFISRKMECMQQDHEKLQTIVGKRVAIKLVAETLENVEEVRKPQGEHHDEKDAVSRRSANPTYSDCDG